jgi:putative pyruvate formate lyase activating enzyme
MIAECDILDRVTLANVHLEHCGLCEHRCGADRRSGTKGPCQATTEARVFRHRVEYGEELELIPSHLFYLSGCDLRCKFCIAEANAFNPRIGAPLTAEFLAQALREGSTYKPRNIQWVGGEPTIHIPAILEAIRDQDQLPPVVWKSDFYGTREAFELLDGVVDTYVADFKFGQNTCAKRIAGVDRYFETVTRNFMIASGQCDLIIRHLLLPGHFDCCFQPIVHWLAANLRDAKFSLRDGYLPRWQAHRDHDLCRPLDAATSRRATLLAREHNLNLVR